MIVTWPAPMMLTTLKYIAEWPHSIRRSQSATKDAHFAAYEKNHPWQSCIKYAGVRYISQGVTKVVYVVCLHLLYEST